MEDLIKRIEELEERVATLEGQIQEQHERRFIPEDSNGICKNTKPCEKHD